MKSITKNILFPTDFSEESMNALEYAIDYAERSGCGLTLLNVIEYPWKILEPITTLITTNVFNREEVAETTKQLLFTITKKIKRTHSIKVDYRIAYGNLVNTVMDYLALKKTEMLILGIKSSITCPSILSSSSAYKIADRADIPVITVNSHNNFKKIEKILFPISDQYYTAKKLKVIIRISRIYEAEVLLFGVAQFGNDSLDEMSMLMESLLEGLEEQNIKTKINMAISDNYAEEILKFSKENDVDLISIVSNFEHGITSVLKSTPDQRLVNESEIPVLSIPIEVERSATSEIETEYISPWSMKYDANKIIIPLKRF